MTLAPTRGRRTGACAVQIGHTHGLHLVAPIGVTGAGPERHSRAPEMQTTPTKRIRVRDSAWGAPFARATGVQITCARTVGRVQDWRRQGGRLRPGHECRTVANRNAMPHWYGQPSDSQGSFCTGHSKGSPSAAANSSAKLGGHATTGAPHPRHGAGNRTIGTGCAVHGLLGLCAGAPCGANGGAEGRPFTWAHQKGPL